MAWNVGSGTSWPSARTHGRRTATLRPPPTRLHCSRSRPAWRGAQPHAHTVARRGRRDLLRASFPTPSDPIGPRVRTAHCAHRRADRPGERAGRFNSGRTEDCARLSHGGSFSVRLAPRVWSPLVSHEQRRSRRFNFQQLSGPPKSFEAGVTRFPRPHRSEVGRQRSSRTIDSAYLRQVRQRAGGCSSGLRSYLATSPSLRASDFISSTVCLAVV